MYMSYEVGVSLEIAIQNKVARYPLQPMAGKIVGSATRMRASFQHKPKWSNRHDNKRGVPIEGTTSNLFLGVKLIVDS